MRNYLPSPDADFHHWQGRFVQLLAERLEAFQALSRASFERPSLAYLDGEEIAPDVPRFRDEAVCTLSDGETLAGFLPMCVLDGLLIGTRADWDGIWESADGGDTWVQTAAGLPVFKMWALASGALLFMSNVPYPPGSEWRVRLFRSAPGLRGRDIDPLNMPPPSLTYRVQGAEHTGPEDWSVCQAPHGTILANEYNVPPFTFPGTHVYRSTDDGVSFQVAYVEEDPIRHAHAVAYHAAAGRWVNVYGDGAAQNKIVFSDDDGLTWADLPGHGQPGVHAQPVALLDYGDPRKLLMGGDEVWSVATLDVLDGAIEQLYLDNGRADQLCAFLLARHAGVFYALAAPGEPNPAAGLALLASPDLRRWAVYHRFTAGESAVGCAACFSAGRLHFRVQSAAGPPLHFRVSPARAGVRPALLIEPPTLNLLTEAQSTAPKWWDWGQVACTIAESDAFARHGGASGKVTANPDAAECVVSVNVPAVADRSYRARVALYSPNNRVWGNLYGHTIPSWAMLTPHHWFGLGPYWQEVESPVWTCAPGDNMLGLFLRFYSEAPGEIEVYVDCAQVEEAPATSWQLGGAPRAGEAVEHDPVALPQAWANLMRVSPLSASGSLTGGPFTVKTWLLDAENHLSLRFDPASTRFELVATQAGEPATLLQSAPQTWQRNGGIVLGIALDAGATRLFVANGGPLEVATAAPLPLFLGATLSARHAGATGANPLPHALSADRILPRALSEADVTAWIDRLVLPGS